MMIRTAPKAEISLRGLAALAITIIGLSAATLAAALSSDNSEDVADVMHRAQTQSNVRGFEELLGTLGAKPEATAIPPAPEAMPVSGRVPTNAPVRLRPTQSA